jgi:hypothetical protein
MRFDMDFYKDQFLLNDNKFQVIYKSDRSPNFYIRVWTGEEYINRSLRTSDKEDAIRNALILVSDIRTKISFRQPVKDPTIRDILNWYNQSSFSDGMTPTRLHYINACVEKVILFMKTKKVERISYDDWSKYWDFRLDFSAQNESGAIHSVRDKSGLNRPSRRTLAVERQGYNQVMKAALTANRIARTTKMPAFPYRRFGEFYRPSKIEAKSTFTKAQYRELREAVRDHAIAKHKAIELRIKLRGAPAGKARQPHLEAYLARGLEAYLSLLRNCGCRRWEALNIKMKDLVEVKVKTQHGDRIAMGVEITSTKLRAYHTRTAILTYSGEQALLEWLKYKKSKGISDDPEAYVFSTYDDGLIRVRKEAFPQGFDRILNKLGWRYFPDGSKINMGAIRRLFIITRLDAGVDINLVAMTCGNSASTIKAYYDSVLLSRYATHIYQSSYYPEDDE